MPAPRRPVEAVARGRRGLEHDVLERAPLGRQHADPDAARDQPGVERRRRRRRGPAADRSSYDSTWPSSSARARVDVGRADVGTPGRPLRARRAAPGRTSRPRSRTPTRVAQLLDLGEQVAGQEDRGAGRVAGRAAARGSRGCPAGRGRWSARRAPAAVAAGSSAWARPRRWRMPSVYAAHRPLVDTAEPDLVERVVDASGPAGAPTAGPSASMQPAGWRARTGVGTPPAPRPARRPAAARRAPRVGIGRPSTSIVPARGEHQPEQHPHRRRLAGAVGAEEAVDVALANVEVDAVDGA